MIFEKDFFRESSIPFFHRIPTYFGIQYMKPIYKYFTVVLKRQYLKNFALDDDSYVF